MSNVPYSLSDIKRITGYWVFAAVLALLFAVMLIHINRWIVGRLRVTNHPHPRVSFQKPLGSLLHITLCIALKTNVSCFPERSTFSPSGSYVVSHIDFYFLVKTQTTASSSTKIYFKIKKYSPKFHINLSHKTGTFWPKTLGVQNKTLAINTASLRLWSYKTTHIIQKTLRAHSIF